MRFSWEVRSSELKKKNVERERYVYIDSSVHLILNIYISLYLPEKPLAEKNKQKNLCTTKFLKQASFSQSPADSPV